MHYYRRAVGGFNRSYIAGHLLLFETGGPILAHFPLTPASTALLNVDMQGC